MQALLFDMDGTLVDTEHLWLAAETATMADLGARWTPQDQAHCLGGPLERAIDYMVERAGGGHDHTEVAAALIRRMQDLMALRPVQWRPGARELVVAARTAGVPRALVSASWRVLVDAVLAAAARDIGPDAFDVTVAGDEVRHGKPDPEPYTLAARLLAVPPQRCVVVEDSPTGVASGVAAGALVVAVPHLVDIAPTDRVVVVGSLSDVTMADLRGWLGP